MSTSRHEQIMVGVFVEKLPFDEWADENEKYICGDPDESLWAMGIGHESEDGYVIGRSILFGSEFGFELTSISYEDVPQIASELVIEIKNKFDMSVSVEDIKLYIFSSSY